MLLDLLCLLDQWVNLSYCIRKMCWHEGCHGTA
jgi:hypothetical protein